MTSLTGMGMEARISEVRWCGDVEASLGELHRQMLEPEALAALLPDAGTLEMMAKGLLQMLQHLPPEFVGDGTSDTLRQAIAEIESNGVPSSREQVMVVMTEALGTGSALDIDGVSETEVTEALIATPLPSEQSRDLFGSDAPSVEQVRAVTNWQMESRSAHYVVCTDATGPTHVVFAGLSGD